MTATALAYSQNPFSQNEQCAKPRPQPDKLWLCAYFPDLALESLGLDLAQAIAIQETAKGHPILQALSVSARHYGIEPGMTPAAALALCPNLIIHLRDVELEKLAMQKLAQAAMTFSPWLSLDQPQCLLLEISSCLTLFGGAGNLREKLQHTLLKLNHRPVIAITPSSEASLLLAKQGLEQLITDKRTLRSTLGRLPVNALTLDKKTIQRLQRTGIRQLADLWRLPRDGLARRYGKALLQQLDALAGQNNRVLNAYQPPASFYARRDMPVELERLEHLFPAIVQLADEFAAFLLIRDAAALGLKLEILHHALPTTSLELDFRTGSRNAKHWLNLLHEKLERSPLPAPVTALALSSNNIAPFQPERFTLFDDESLSNDGEWCTVLDQLQARLGHSTLKQFSLQDDHRPERAMVEQPTKSIQTQNLPERPLWLLSKPKPIDIRDLQLQPEIERIESGWWDNALIRRDYRMAKDKCGRKLWVFQDLNSSDNWFLHGLFG